MKILSVPSGKSPVPANLYPQPETSISKKRMKKIIFLF
jgi:hypothetical protein